MTPATSPESPPSSTPELSTPELSTPELSTPELSTLERAALDALDADGTAALLLELLAIPSVTASPAESDLQHRLAAHFDSLGLEVDLWSMDVAALRADPAFPGLEVERTEAWGLVATTPETAGAVGGAGGIGGAGPGVEGGERTLILQGHVDVVPPGDPAAWGGDPFVPRRRGDTIIARGACDMKGGLVANIAAVTALRAAGIRLAGRLALHAVVSEEDGGLGAFGTLARGHTGDSCIITEPTAGTLITATAGALTFRLEVPGRAAHGSMRTTGVSAIDAFATVHDALKALERRRNENPDPVMAEYEMPFALSVGTLRTGDWASSVPDRLVAEGRYGVRLGESLAAARAEFEACVASTCAADPWLSTHPVVVTWPGGSFASGALSPSHPLAECVSAAYAQVSGGPQGRGARPRVHGAPYGSDLRLYAGAGIPTLHLGPGDVALAHGPEESVRLAEVLTVARTLVVTAIRTLGVRI